MRKLALTLLAALLIPAAVSAWDRSYHPAPDGMVRFNKVTSIEFFGWKTDLDGVVNIENGTDIDLDRDVGFGNENRFGLRISHVLSRKSALELAYFKHDHSGTINRAVRFENRNYQASANMRLQNSWLDLVWSYNLINSKEVDEQGRDAFYLDGQFGVKINSSEISVSGRDALGVRLEESWSEAFPVPYLGLAAGGQLSERLWLRGNLRIIKVNAGGYQAMHNDYSLNAALRMNPGKASTEWFMDIGYRGVRFNLEGEGDKAEIRYTGPTLGTFVRF